MNMKSIKMAGFGLMAALAAGWVHGARLQPSLTGDYLEVRSCDIYTGACVANSEMGLSGREGMLVWKVGTGSWQGTRLDGLSVIAVIRTQDTLGDVRYQPREGQAVLIVDSRADHYQHDALVDFARSAAGSLLRNIAAIKSAPIASTMGTCAAGSCATVKAGPWVEITTRCLAGKDHLCGNEENYYPPLTTVQDARSAYTELATFTGSELNVTWELAGKRSAYLATFAR